jgi:hypothetical protein
MVHSFSITGRSLLDPCSTIIRFDAAVSVGDRPFWGKACPLPARLARARPPIFREPGFRRSSKQAFFAIAVLGRIYTAGVTQG